MCVQEKFNFTRICLLCSGRWFQLLSLSMKPWCMSTQMKSTDQYFHAVLFIMLCKVVLTNKYVDETLACDHSNERY